MQSFLQSKLTLAMLAVATLVLVAMPSPKQAAASSPDSDVVDVGPSLITEHVKDASLTSVLQDISKQSGNQIRVRPFEMNNPSEPTVTLDVDAQPFFSVVDQICDQTGLNLGSAQDGSLILSPNPFFAKTNDHVRFDHGPFRVIAERLEHATILTADQNANDYCELELTGLPEQRLNVLYYSTASLAEQAVDENGISLVPPTGTSLDDPRINTSHPPYEANHIAVHIRGQGEVYTHHLLLKIPPTAGRRIKHLTGTFTCWAASENQTVEITNLNGTEKSPVFTPLSNGLQLAAYRFNASGNRLAVGLKRAGGTDQQWADDEHLLQGATISVVAKDGTATASPNFGASWGPREHWISVLADQRTTAKLVVVFPVSATRIDTPIELNDVPLP
jgi:hypothetical protein